MKQFNIVILTLSLSSAALASPTRFVLEDQAGIPFHMCEPSDTELRIQILKKRLPQKAQIMCNATVTQLAPLKIIRDGCEAGQMGRAVVAQVEFECQPPQVKIVGVGYKVQEQGVANTGPTASEAADSDAMGQCGSNIVRTSDYSEEIVSYKYRSVRYLTRAQYECVR